jgi:hypothetical protein
VVLQQLLLLVVVVVVALALDVTFGGVATSAKDRRACGSEASAATRWVGGTCAV